MQDETIQQGLQLKALKELKGGTFIIPFQQRGYKWTQNNVKELLYDIKDFMDCPNTSKRIYCLQPLTVVNKGDNRYSILDGQQRLTTLFLLYMYLEDKSPYTFQFERDKSDNNDTSPKRYEFLQNIASANEKTKNENIDYFYIYQAYQQIKETFKEWGSFVEESFKGLLNADKDKKSVQVIWYEVKEKKEHETFRNLNSGKIQLTNTELIKALLLNNASGLPNNERIEAASQFEQIEREIQNDHFWYMFNSKDVRRGQTRMDMLFNLVSGCTQEDYELDPRCSFRNYFDKPERGTLSEKWKKVRHTFLRLKDLYNNIYCYHYIGFLTYHRGGNSLEGLKELLKKCESTKHQALITSFKDEIKIILRKSKIEKKKEVSAEYESVTDFNYNVPKPDLRELFLMHNIETLLQRYELHKGDTDREKMMQDFEHFPFNLFHNQHWDIEHIASYTKSDFKNDKDRKDWLDSIKEDLGEDYGCNAKTLELEKEYNSTNDKKKERFDELYKHIMEQYEEKIADAIPDDDPNGNGKDKMQIGNITLLDSHTNRSYHNALFPRKRCYVIVADGLMDSTNKLDKEINKVYVPICTRQVFTKSYNKSASLNLNVWTQTDADAYVKDMEQKLQYYFPQNNKEL